MWAHALIYYRTPPGSGDIDFNVFGFGAFVLGEMHREQPILELRFYFVAIGIIGQGEAPHKGAVAAFDAVIFLFLSSFSNLRSPEIVSTPFSTATFTSSFLSSGNSALIRYSFSSSVMSANG